MPPANVPRPTLERLLSAVAVAAATLSASTFLVAAAARLVYPFELEWLESEMLQHTLRSRAGETLYAAPAAAFSPTIYPPLYAWSSALASFVVGPTFVAPRLVSVLATLGAASLAGYVAWTLSGSRRGGLFGAALMLAGYVPCGSFFDLARVDSLWVFLLLAATAAAARARTGRAAVAAGLLFALATATKQPAGLFALAAAAGLVLRSYRLAAVMVAAWLLPALGFWAALHAFTDGWSTVYTVLIPFRVPHHPGVFVHFLRDDLAHNFAPALCLLVLWGLTPKTARPGGSLPLGWWLPLAAAVGATVLMRTLQGGGANTLMSLVAFAAVLAGAVAGRVLHAGSGPARMAVLVAMAVQFLGQTYNPLTLLPDAAGRARAEAFVETVREIPGDVWVPSHTSFAHLAGKPFWVHRDPLLDLQYSGWDAFPDDLEAKLRSGAFAAVVTDGPFVEERLQAALDAGYELARELADGPELHTGYRTRPRFVYRPRAERANSP